MKVKALILFVIIITLSLGLLSCTSYKSMLNERLSELNTNNDNKIADTQFQNIIKSLENKDKEGLKKIFSPNAVKEANDIDGGIDYLMKFYKGKMKSRDEGTIPSTDLVEDGEKKRELDCKYEVTTDEDTYIVFFVYQRVDTKNPDNVGVYMLQIIKKSDEEKEFDWGGDKTRCAGIYRPSIAK